VQATCPHCSQSLSIDDASLPDRAFSIRCPRCQSSVRFLSKGSLPLPANGKAASASNGGAASASAPSAPSAFAGEELRAETVAGARRESANREPGGAGRAIVALPDPSQADLVARALTRLGFAVETVQSAEEAARSIEQGACALLATNKTTAGIGVPPTLYQRLNRLSGTARRGVFVVLVGNDFQTGDTHQAFSSSADLVLHPQDLAGFDGLLRATMAERQRLYQAFLEAQARFEASGATRSVS